MSFPSKVSRTVTRCHPIHLPLESSLIPTILIYNLVLWCLQFLKCSNFLRIQKINVPLVALKVKLILISELMSANVFELNNWISVKKDGCSETVPASVAFEKCKTFSREQDLVEFIREMPQDK